MWVTQKYNWSFRYLAGVAVAALAIALYFPGLQGGFLFDDYKNIVENSAVHIQQLDSDSLRSSLKGPDAGPLGRPVSILSFAITYYYFGLDPFAFKAINLTIHLVNALLVAWLTSLLLQFLSNKHSDRRSTQWLPIWVATVWLFHPINTIPILLAVQRMTLLSGMFLLLALIFHLKGIANNDANQRNWGWLALGWLVCWPLAILSKETGLLFPLFALLVTLFGTANKPASNRPRRITPIIAVTVILALTIVAMVDYLGIRWLAGAYLMRPFTVFERLLTELRVLWFYAGQIVIPVHSSFGLYLDDIQLSHSLIDPPATLLSLFGWVAAVAAIVFGWRRWPIPVFGLAWFLVGHSLESTILPLEIAHEYRNYIPSIGLILGIAYIGCTLLQSIKLDHPRLSISLVVLLPIVYVSMITWMRADQWHDTLRGSQLEAMHHPDSSRANYMAARELFASGRGDRNDLLGAKMVSYHFEKGASSDQTDKNSYLGLIHWACASQRPVDRAWIDGLSSRLKLSPFAPSDLGLPHLMLKLFLRNPDCLSRQDSIALLTAAGDNEIIAPSIRSAFFEAAADYSLLVFKDPPSAAQYLKQAVALRPEDSALAKKLKTIQEAILNISNQIIQAK